MKKSIISIGVLLCSFTAFSQVSDSLALVQLKQKVGQLQTALKNQESDFLAQIDTLQAQIEALRAQSQQIADSLGVKITDTRAAAGQQIASVDQSLDKTTVWVIFGILLAIVLSGILYFLLRRKQQSDKAGIIALLNHRKQEMAEQMSNAKADMTGQLTAVKQHMLEQVNNTKTSIEGNLAKELAKQAEAIDALAKSLASSKKKQSKT